MDGTLTRLEKNYDKNVVLLTRREYIKVQLQLEECERRHQEIFNPNIGKLAYNHSSSESKASLQTINPPPQFVLLQDLVHTQV